MKNVELDPYIVINSMYMQYKLCFLALEECNKVKKFKDNFINEKIQYFFDKTVD